MTKTRVITQAHTKRTTAAALADAKSRRDWSNADLGDALGVSEGTIRNRIDGDCPNHQMNVFELARSIQSDGVDIANRILGELVDHHVEPNGCASAIDAIAIAGLQAQCAADLITAGADGFDREEAKTLLPKVVEQIGRLEGLEAHLRAVIAGHGTG